MKQRFVEGKKAAFHDLVDTLKTYCELSLDYFMIGERPDVTNYAADILNKESNPTFQPTFGSDQWRLSLVLNSKLAVRLYIPNLAEGAAAHYVDTMNHDSLLKSQQNKNSDDVGGRKGNNFFEISGITPTRLDEQIRIIHDGTTYTFTPLSWAYRVMVAADNDMLWHDMDYGMACILYEYYLNARTFAGMN